MAWSRLRGRWRARGHSLSVELPTPFLELARNGPAPLARVGSVSERSLHIATVIPPFRRGSGGHATIVKLMRELVRRGHTVSLWLEDWAGRPTQAADASASARFSVFFDAGDFDLQTGFGHWDGADVVLATGWQTVPRALLLGGARARAYLVQDHEPEFYGASAEALFAQWTYRQGVHCIAASPWLADLLHTRYQASASHFDLAVDHGTYREMEQERRRDLVVFYARTATARRAVPLGLLALAELSRRRPGIEIALFGADRSLVTSFPHSDLGVLDAAGLARLYSRATVGMAFSLTNPSLVGLEMLACGLPCVELATESMLATFGHHGPVRLVEPEPLQLVAALEEVIDDGDLRRHMARQGVAFTAPRTWRLAADQVEDGLRTALGVEADQR